MMDEMYQALRKQLDNYSLGFPTTQSGIELKILKKLFSKEDAELFLQMTQKLETADQIARRTNQPVDLIADRLEDMAERGLLFRLKRDGESNYGTIAFVHGLFEFQLKNLDKELARMVEQYHREGFNNAFKAAQGMFLRTVPVQQSIDVTWQVAAYDDAVNILREKDLIVVADCICRKKSRLLDTGCDKVMEACFMFGSMAKYYLDRDMGRRIDVDEAIAILKQAQDSGLVTQPATAQNPTGMCNCCGDCCGVLVSIKQFPTPAQLVRSNYFAAIDHGLCTGCETCLERCQMDAIALDEDNLAVVNTDRCIGCGLCVTTCPTEAAALVAKPEAEHFLPPLNSRDQMRTMAEKRGIQ